MEKMKGTSLMDRRAEMIKELVQGIELVKQLRLQMLVSSADNSRTSLNEDDQALSHLLVDKMLSAFDKSISLAKLFDFNELHRLHSHSPHSPAHIGPGSEHPYQDPRPSKKRRKMSPRIQWVRVCPGESGSALGGPVDDGFSWRKYGQKEILKAKYPRGYYRCTHRHTKGCNATKQVQKSDEDPSIYQVIYQGEHTCTQMAHLGQTQEKPNATKLKSEPQSQSQLHPTLRQQCQIPASNQEEITLGFDQDEYPKYGPIEKEDEPEILRALSFNSAEHEPGLVEDWMLSSSSGLWSPSPSESNYFSALPWQITALGPGLNLQISDSEFNELVSGLSSVSNSPNVGGFEFPSDEVSEMGASFSFDPDSFLCPI